MKKNLIVFALAITGLLLGGCAKPPQAELDAVVASVEKTKIAEADVYLPTQYAALQDSMNAINAEVEIQKSKMFGNYSVVKEKIVALETMAMEVETNTAVKKQQITEEVNALYAQLETLAVENNALVENAPKGKEGKAAIEAIKGELTVIEASVAEIPVMLEAGKLLPAQAKAKAAIEKATALNTELNTVVEKYNKKKK